MNLPHRLPEGITSTGLLAHVDALGPQSWGELARAWSFEPLVVLSLLASAWVYRRGSQRLRREVGAQRGLRRWERASFWAGWSTLVLALVSPVHEWGSMLFAAHMTQHELLILVAAPLLVLGRPVVALLFAMPRPDARQLSRMARRRRVRQGWRVLMHPVVAWMVHAVALWAWHAPALYQATLTSDFLHTLQHASFFLSALIFWWALIQARAGLLNSAVAVLFLFTTMIHSGLLGALITFSSKLVYPAYAERTTAWGLTALEDQQLGGLIMWVPGGVVYIIAALALVAGWLRGSERRAAVSALARAATTAPLLLVALLMLPGCGDAR